MFIGHFAPALVAATHRQAPSLPVLFIAAQLVDWLFFAFLLTGTEAMRMTPDISVMNPLDLYHMPYTHSLLGALAFGGGTTIIVWFIARVAGNGTTVVAWPRQAVAGNGSTVVMWPRGLTAGLIAGAVVVSHWFLDLLVHVPDLTLAGSPPKLGFGLWNYPFIEMPLELALIGGALLFYAKAAKPKALPLCVLCGTMLLFQAVSWFGPVDREVTTGTSLLAFAAFGIITAAAYWVGRSAARQ